MSDQTLNQTPGPEAVQRYPNRYKPGQSGNLRGRPSRAELRANVVAKMHQLAESIGGFDRLNHIEQTLIERAAELLLRRPRRQEDVVKRDNLVSRILRDALRRHQIPNRVGRPRKNNLDEYLRRSA